jgi:hypothetical protein
MFKGVDQTFRLGNYPLEKIVMRCLRCGREGRFDKAALIEKLGRKYPVWEAVVRIERTWECSRQDRFKAEARKPPAKFCRAYLPEFDEIVRQFHLDINWGRKPSVAVYLRDEPQPASKA